MKFNEHWLREWVNPNVNTNELCQQLTMAGLEVESIESDSKDHVIELNITPNRGDCLSIIGIARDLAAINGLPLPSIDETIISPQISDTADVTVHEHSACPRYLCRIIRNIDSEQPTPTWILERLCYVGIKPVSLVVDILNYTMIELGQPMHAFDLDSTGKEIEVRFAKEGETCKLLDEQITTLQSSTLVISNKTEVLALAGIMGGFNSRVTSETRDILLESAFFSEKTLSGQARQYGLQTDAAYRFERGVDPYLARAAMEKATQLLVTLAHGQPGPIVEKVNEATLPKHPPITLHLEQINNRLGIKLNGDEVHTFLSRLGCKITPLSSSSWEVIPQSYRFDLSIAEDLIEEIARLYGYDRIPAEPLWVEASPKYEPQSLEENRLKSFFQDRGYQEIISYSFISALEQARIDPLHQAAALINPISQEMAVMRTTLWPGLLNTLKFNLNRQASRARLFEIGQRFIQKENELIQEFVLSGLIAGSFTTAQWGLANRKVDFFDLKQDLENWFSFLGIDQNIELKATDELPALHPGQAAAIYHDQTLLGYAGLAHPSLLSDMDIKVPAYLFELKLAPLLNKPTKLFKPLSKFPAVRRDFAFIVPMDVPAASLADSAREIMQDLLIDCSIFDLFMGESIGNQKKSIALGLTLQHPSRTLNDEEVNELSRQFVEMLQAKFHATLRDAS